MASVEESDVVSDSNQYRPSFLSHFRRPASEDAGFLVQLDHCYAKPWSALTDTCSHAKPACHLFMSKFPRSSDKEPLPTWDIDVVTEESPNVPPYDQDKARLLMTECERNINFARIEQVVDEAWEEKVNRDGWSMSQTRLFNRVMKALQSDRLARLANTGHPNEPVLRRLCIDKTAKRIRQALAGAAWDPVLTRWLHSTLITVLGQSTLATYLDVLQTVFSKAPAQVALMMGWSDEGNSNPKDEALKLLLKRPWDPVANFLSMHQLNKLPKDVILVMVPDLPADAACSPASLKRLKVWSTQLSVLGKVVHVSVDSLTTAAEFVGSVESAVLAKCSEVHDCYPALPIILIGWQIGALIACKLSCLDYVSAVITLGFPTNYLKGTVNDADELLVEMKTPTLFVVGQNASTCCIDDLEDMRANMSVDNSLVIVGGADDRLRMSHGRRRYEGVTQSMVDRCVLEKIGEFLVTVLTTDTVSTVVAGSELCPAEPPAKFLKSATTAARSSSLFDPLAGGDAQALLMQSGDTQVHHRLLKRHPEVKRKRRNTSHISELCAMDNSASSVTGHQLILSSGMTQNPVVFTQSITADALKQRYNVLGMPSAVTSALKERLKKPSALSTSLNIAMGSLSASLGAAKSSTVRASTPQIQQLLKNAPGGALAYRFPVLDNAMSSQLASPGLRNFVSITYIMKEIFL
jgi:hypothetical protein